MVFDIKKEQMPLGQIAIEFINDCKEIEKAKKQKQIYKKTILNKQITNVANSVKNLIKKLPKDHKEKLYLETVYSQLINIKIQLSIEIIGKLI